MLFRSVKPAAVFNLPYGTVAEGAVADLVLIDLAKEQAIDRTTFVSKGKNTPFNEKVVQGWPVMTIFEGEIVYQEDAQ